MGSIRFFIFYLLSGVAASATQIIADTGSVVPMVGASGAIGGVMGAYIVLYPKVHVHMFFFFRTFAIPAILMLGYWIVMQLVGGFTSLGSTGGGVAFWAHVGGFVAGRDAPVLQGVRAHPQPGRHEDHAWCLHTLGRNYRELLADQRRV